MAALLILAAPCYAKPWHYRLLEDLKTVGDVVAISDDSDMQMTFDVTYPYWLVRYQLRQVMEDSKIGFDTESGNGEQAYLESRWFTNSVDGVANFFSGIDQARVRFEGRVVNIGPNQTRLILASRLQVQASNNNRGWVDKSEREMRNIVREMATTTFLRCRYPTELAIRQSVGEDYIKLKKRQGKKGYELPPRQRVSMSEVADRLKFSWCAQDDCLEMPIEGAQHCARHKPTPKPVVVETQPTSVADELRKLKELADDGVITAEEFEAQKRKLLED